MTAPTPAPTPAPAPAPTRGALARQILQLAAPTTGLSMLQVTAQLIETALAARQGTAALAGWAVMLPFALLLAQMSTGAMGGGVVSAVARALGGQRRSEASALVLHAMLIATGFGALFAVGLLLGAGALLRGVAGPEAAQAAWAYAAWLFGLGAIPAWWTNTLASVLRGGGQHALAARVLSLQWAAMPVLAWWLAEPAGLGLAGLGAAYALTNAVAAAAMLRVVQQGRAGFQPAWRGRPTRALFVQILSVGAVASGLAMLANLTTLIVTAQLRHLGPAMVAAYGIAARLEFLVIPLAWGVGSALTALVGRHVGAGDWASARRIAWIGGLMALTATAVIGLAVAYKAPLLAGWFTQDAQVAALAARALRYTGPAFGGFGLGMAMYFAAMGARRMRAPVLASLARLSIATVGGGLLAAHSGLGTDGHFLGVALGITAYGLIAAGGVRPAVWRMSQAAQR